MAQNGVAGRDSPPSAEVSFFQTRSVEGALAESSPPDSRTLESVSLKPLDSSLEDSKAILDAFGLSEEVGQSLLVVKKKGPSSLLGTGSSVTSASDHSEVSDFESDSGIETSNAATTSPEVGVVSPLSLSPTKKKKKGLKDLANILPHDDLPVTVGKALDEPPNLPGLSDIRIDSFINCLDDKLTKDMLTEEALQLLRLIPDGYIPLPHQVGGHRHVYGKLGFLRGIGQNHVLLKPVPHPNGPREVMFYKKVFKSHFNDDSEDMKVLKELIPEYYGSHDLVDRAGEMHKYIKLEDIVSKFRKPCIMDLKMGRRVWDDYAQQDKIDREMKKYPYQEVIGFRIIGMRIYRESTDDYVYYDKEYGRKVAVSGVLESLGKFFNEGDVSRNDVIGPIIERLHFILRLMEHQKVYRFFATSVLIVYEGDTNRPIRKPKDFLDIRLVDFAHAFECDPRNEPDFNTIFGISNLIKYLEQLRVDDQTTH